MLYIYTQKKFLSINYELQLFVLDDFIKSLCNTFSVPSRIVVFLSGTPWGLTAWLWEQTTDGISSALGRDLTETDTVDPWETLAAGKKCSSGDLDYNLRVNRNLLIKIRYLYS